MSWIVDMVGQERVASVREEAVRKRLHSTLSLDCTELVDAAELAEIGSALELQVLDLLADDGVEQLRLASAEAFQVLRAVSKPPAPIEAAVWLLRLSCIAILGDRGPDARRILVDEGIPELPVNDPDWGRRVWATVLDTWLRVLRRDGWADLDRIQKNVVSLRGQQRAYEPEFLAQAQTTSPAWRLVAQYHLARAAEVLAVFVSQGTGPDGRFDIHQQMEAQFDRALGACRRGQLVELEVQVRILARAASAIVDNSIWTVTRAVNSRVTKFVKDVVSRARNKPIFEMLPPQRQTLREEGLLGSGHRSVVVSLPTSSGKTMIAQFRILQALNQFDHERGWVAYLAPTRALVKQLAVRLRRDFAPLGIGVERVSPALEVDGIEASMLTEQNEASQFRVLVTTPEKLDLMLRGEWESKIGRPLTLVVVDEAHNLQSPSRGIKLELLLATINRECRFAQFLLLTPFIENASQVARWLAPESHADVQMAVDWAPNDRVIAIAEPEQGRGRGAFKVRLHTLHTSKHTLAVPESLLLPENRPLGLSWSRAKGQGALAAATAQQLRGRGAVIVLADKPRNSWSLAKHFMVEANQKPTLAPAVEIAKAFLIEEFGSDFALVELLDYGVGVHHAGLSDEAKAIVEWLTEEGHIDVLVATTTIAQGVNFPVSAVVLASHQYPYGLDMPPEDFWNIAGRAGRVDQEDLGIVALAAGNAESRTKLESFVATSVRTLNSTLIDMVLNAHKAGLLASLHALSWKPEWSSFLQYLVHTYRQIGDHDRFSVEVEQVLRGTLGFQALRRDHPKEAAEFVTGVRMYGESLAGRPLKLVDTTGFSLETVTNTLSRLSQSGLREDAWDEGLLTMPRPRLSKMMGLLLQVPELSDNLREVLGGDSPNGDKLARIVCDWVQGTSLEDMAERHFPVTDKDGLLKRTDSMTKCCQRLFGKLTQTASWGLAALQALTFKDKLDALSELEQRSLRNLPARVYYGVNSDAALALRLVGVPRQAAAPVADAVGIDPGASPSEVRALLKQSGEAPWRKALGDLGPIYHAVWSIVEGEPPPIGLAGSARS